MTQYIKKVKFSGILKDFEDKPRTDCAKGKATRAFITDVLSEDGKIRKSFYWLEKNVSRLEQLSKGQDVSFIVKY